jgi:glucose/arabinose dehydrogenase
MKRHAALALLLCSFSAIAQIPEPPKPKKPPPVPPPLPARAYALEDAFGGLTFSQPLAIVSAPGEKDRIFVVEKTGCIQVVTRLDQPTPVKHVFANLTERPDGKLDDKGECGVLGLAFHPDYARNGRFFVYYSLRIGGQLHERVSRFRVSPNDPQQADIASEQSLITQADPANNHNGGDLHFGPDGYLYISAGDGGGANDAFNTARFINKDFHAAILRIDVGKRPGSLPPNPHPAIARDENGAAHYAVPADNPFIGATTHHGETIDPATVRTEIWATGLRNPWRFCFDPPTGRLFAGDVGQNLYEEVNLITKGGDYGWSHREGLHAFDLGPGKDQPPAEFHPVDPIFEYPRTAGISITGGRVVRGSKFPELSGAYLFADYGFGRIIVLREKDAKWEHEIIAVENGIAGIGTDPRDGDLLFANLGKGSVMRLMRNPGNTELQSDKD